MEPPARSRPSDLHPRRGGGPLPRRTDGAPRPTRGQRPGADEAWHLRRHPCRHSNSGRAIYSFMRSSEPKVQTDVSMTSSRPAHPKCPKSRARRLDGSEQSRWTQWTAPAGFRPAWMPWLDFITIGSRQKGSGAPSQPPRTDLVPRRTPACDQCAGSAGTRPDRIASRKAS